MGTIGLAGSRTRDGLPAGTVVPRTPRAALVAAVLGTALAYMSDDMLNLAVPSVARGLGATMTDVQWILNAYYVPLVSFVLIAGSIGDIIGHRRVFSAGLVLFSLGALVCALSATVLALIAGRGLQGLGAPSQCARARTAGIHPGSPGDAAGRRPVPDARDAHQASPPVHASSRIHSDPSHRGSSGEHRTTHILSPGQYPAIHPQS